MNYPISQCKATVEITLEQIAEIDKAFTEVEILKSQNAMLRMQLETAQFDLSVIVSALYVTLDDANVWVEHSVKNKPEVWEEFILTVKRNKQ